MLDKTYRECFTQIVGRPATGALTQDDVFILIAALRNSEIRKSQCGLRLIAYYEKLRLAKR